MKLLKLVPVTLLFVFFAVSCEKEDSEFVATATSPIQLEDLSISTIVIDGSNPGNPAVTFNWNNANFSQPVVENYRLEFSSDQDFSDAITAASTSGLSTVTLTMSGLNARAGDLDLPPLELNTIYARVTASIGDQNELASISNTISFNVVPSFNYPFKDLYFVGPASVSGWDNNNNNSVLFRDPLDSDKFSYTGYFEGGQPLKILEQRGAWAPQYGEDSQGVLAFRPTEDDPDPAPINDIESLSSGYYTFELDLDDSSFSLTTYDASAAPVYNSVAIEGDAVSGTSVMMSPASFDQEQHIWRIQNTPLRAGSLRFVVDGTSWGGSTEFSGVASPGGDEIPVIVGDDYEIWFNDLTGDYQFIPLTLSQ